MSLTSYSKNSRIVSTLWVMCYGRCLAFIHLSLASERLTGNYSKAMLIRLRDIKTGPLLSLNVPNKALIGFVYMTFSLLRPFFVRPEVDLECFMSSCNCLSVRRVNCWYLHYLITTQSLGTQLYEGQCYLCTVCCSILLCHLSD